MDTAYVIQCLQDLQEPGYAEKMNYFGVQGKNSLGIRMPKLRALAKEIGRDQALAEALWHEDIHEAKLLAVLLVEPKKLNEALMDQWGADLYSWDLVDQFCTPWAKMPWTWDKAMAWSRTEPEFLKRAGFVLVVTMSIHHKKLPDERLVPFFARMEEEAWDGRNFVKKAVNWALRTLGKRSLGLHPLAIACAERIKAQSHPSAKWIASDALRELESEKVMARLEKKGR